MHFVFNDTLIQGEKIEKRVTSCKEIQKRIEVAIVTSCKISFQSKYERYELLLAKKKGVVDSAGGYNNCQLYMQPKLNLF